ncbi:MAG: DUF2892 domain-containing protein [Nitrospirae bacterium]|nr:MAG: DUF2892 domain-containing protein [Nitrospirota bacterium]
MLSLHKYNMMPIERWIRLIAGFQAMLYSLLSYYHSYYWNLPLILMGWTFLLSFFINCSPLMILFWSLGVREERPPGARSPWIIGKGTVFYIERWTRLLAGLVYLTGGIVAFIHVDLFGVEHSYWSLFTAAVGFIQFQGAFSNWCPSLSFLKWMGAKDERSLNEKSTSS